MQNVHFAIIGLKNIVRYVYRGYCYTGVIYYNTVSTYVWPIEKRIGKYRNLKSYELSLWCLKFQEHHFAPGHTC